MRTRFPVNMRLTREAITLLAAIARKHGITRTAVVEMIVRDTARREKVGA